MDRVRKGLLTVVLNDKALMSFGDWYPELEEFQIDECPPSKHHYWDLSGLTYPLFFSENNTERIEFRVYSIPTQIKGGFRFKVYRDPQVKTTTSNQRKPERMSPAQQRLADLLGTSKAETQQFMNAVFKLGKEVDGVRLKEITEAVEAHLRESRQRPTPELIFDRICQSGADSFQRRMESKRNEASTVATEYPPALESLTAVFLQFVETISSLPNEVPEYPMSNERMSPSMEKLSLLLGKNKVGTEAFVKRVLGHRKRKEVFGVGDVLPAVERLVNVGKPISVKSVYEELQSVSNQRKKPFKQGAKKLTPESKRKHVSVWEIRN